MPQRTKEIHARIRELLERSDEVFRNANYFEGRFEIDLEENAEILRETNQLLNELRLHLETLGTNRAENSSDIQIEAMA